LGDFCAGKEVAHAALIILPGWLRMAKGHTKYNPHISHICYNHLQYRRLQSRVSRIYLAFTSQQLSLRAFSRPFGSFFSALD